jgi:soluble lytic murein transglycosylase
VLLGLVDWFYERHKERRYDSAILHFSDRYGVDPALVKAVVWRESKFNPKVRGRAGEIGLMQIRSLAAQEWAQAETKRPFEGNLFQPDVNLQVGTWYLAKLVRRYAQTDHAKAYALADYNAGRSNVLRWNRGAAATNSAAFLEQITFPGTQEYIRTVLLRAGKYESLRPGNRD